MLRSRSKYIRHHLCITFIIGSVRCRHHDRPLSASHEAIPASMFMCVRIRTGVYSGLPVLRPVPVSALLYTGTSRGATTGKSRSLEYAISSDTPTSTKSGDIRWTTAFGRQTSSPSTALGLVCQDGARNCPFYIFPLLGNCLH